MLTTEPLTITDVVVLRPPRFADDRGWFQETWNRRAVAEALGFDVDFVQDNESLSRRAGTIRGLHYQRAPFGQGKLVRVIAGSVLDVAVDIRPDSPTYLRHVAVELTARGGEQLWMPPGMAHGFCTLEPNTVLGYKVTDYYNRSADRSLAWNDPRIAIDWPVPAAAAVLSDKDRAAPGVAAMEVEDG